LAAGVHDKTPDPGRYASALAALRAQCPAYVDAADWQRTIEDGRRFITQWGERAEALGWTSDDLFGLHSPPEKPAPNYRRLSRYDQAVVLAWPPGRRFDVNGGGGPALPRRCNPDVPEAR
jgi:hypothetical protein